jgi:hypothetical protein
MIHDNLVLFGVSQPCLLYETGENALGTSDQIRGAVELRYFALI